MENGTLIITTDTHTSRGTGFHSASEQENKKLEIADFLIKMKMWFLSVIGVAWAIPNQWLPELSQTNRPWKSWDPSFQDRQHGNLRK